LAILKLSAQRFYKTVSSWRNVLDSVGCTPLIRLDEIAKDARLKCNLCASIRLPGSWFSGATDKLVLGSGESRGRRGNPIPGKSVAIEPTPGNTGTYDSPILDPSLNAC